MTRSHRLHAHLAAIKARLAAGWRDQRHHVILHIGPHRTGTSTIQATLRANKATGPTGPIGVGMITRKDPTHHTLSRLMHDVLTIEAAQIGGPEIRAAAAQVARKLGPKRVTIISDEDLLGRLPTRKRIKGLYPFVEETLPHILAGFRDEQVRVTVAWQRRDYGDWLDSIYHRRNDLAPEKPFNRKRFQRHYGLPTDWQAFEKRLHRACAGVRVERLSFEDDAASGVMGLGLFRLAGLSDAEIAALDHSPARHAAPMRGTVARFKGAAVEKPEP